MHLRELQRNWDAFGASDPLWAILTDPAKAGNRWNAEEFFATGVLEIEEVMNWIQGIHPLSRWRRALDFGCGVGRLTQPLATYFEEAIGVDLAPSMIRLARQQNLHSDRCRYVLNESADLRCFDDAMFDLIYSGLTLQHMAPRYALAYLAEFLRVLSPGGALVFRLPSEPVPNGYWLRLKRSVSDFLYLRVYWKLFRRGQPFMQMYGIKREIVLQFLIERGSKPLAVEPDTSAGTKWCGFRYLVIRPDSADAGVSGDAQRAT